MGEIFIWLGGREVWNSRCSIISLSFCKLNRFSSHLKCLDRDIFEGYEVIVDCLIRYLQIDFYGEIFTFYYERMNDFMQK